LIFSAERSTLVASLPEVSNLAFNTVMSDISTSTKALKP
jgi:hypothetical protein